ncbi:hypothetical protein AZI09_02870 [Levilactobacillus brevis]|nr:hypothetical protein AZI09_02870 [Levilactobacillus brevis]ARN97130.1 hypothetical protein AZI10_02840 [Levilactobacillus brevis]
MNILTKHFAGQSILSWIFQILLLGLAWLVTKQQIQNNMVTILSAVTLTVLIYISFAFDNRERFRH